MDGNEEKKNINEKLFKQSHFFSRMYVVIIEVYFSKKKEYFLLLILNK